MSTSVTVTCRFRPPSKNEKAEGATIVSQVDPNNTTVTIADGSGGAALGQNKFNFDRVLDFVSTQAEVYQYTAQPLVKEVFAGYNCTIFAYGQTGSGKTHTMMGVRDSPSEKGIIPRLVEAIFTGIEEAEIGIEFTVKLTYVEIYNEKVRDLLTARNSNSDNLKIRELNNGGVYIEGVTETYVNSIEQVYSLMQQGQDNRAIASTNMNEQSSRSHSVFILTLGQLDQNTGSKKGAKLTLVDLAGSEKISKTGAEGQTLKEAQGINKSLSALGNVVNAISTGSAHIPYRDSKLTRLLSDSLGGNSKTVLVVTGSPMSSNMEETLSTMRFGVRAKLIKNKATVNQEKSVAEYKLLLKQAETKINIQSNIIELLEKDVANLLECIQSVDPKALKLPIPSLLSRETDPEVLKAMKAQDDATPPSTAASTVPPPVIPPASPAPTATPSPTPSSPTPAPATPSSPTASTQPELKPEATTAPATPATTTPPVATTAVATPSTSSPVPATKVKKAVRKSVTTTTDDASPPTSPDTSPESSPALKPSTSPPVVTVTLGLPSLASLTNAPSETKATTTPVDGALATLETAATPSSVTTPITPSTSVAASTSNATITRKMSASSAQANHVLADLMLANSDLTQKLAELKQRHTALEHNLKDIQAESQEAAETAEKEKAKMAAQVEEALKAQKAAEAKAVTAEEIVTEFQLLKDKVEYMKKDHALTLSQVESQKIELQEEVQRLTSRVLAMEAKLAAQTKSYETVLEKAAQENAALTEQAATASAALASVQEEAVHPASAPNSPVDKEKKPKPPRMSAPPEHIQPRENATASHPLMAPSPASATSASSDWNEPTYTPEEQSQIDQLNRGLKRKCDQYIQLMMQHQTQGERVEALEAALDDSNARLKEHVATSAKKIKELDEKLIAAENLCAKFLESGRYFRQERASKSKQTTSKIVMPIQGGGHKGGAAGASSSSSASSVTGLKEPLLPGATSIVNSPPPATSTSSRLSEGLASGRKSIVASIQSAFTREKPKDRDSMSSFF